jgi:hypothetical protein
MRTAKGCPVSEERARLGRRLTALEFSRLLPAMQEWLKTQFDGADELIIDVNWSDVAIDEIGNSGGAYEGIREGAGRGGDHSEAG